MHSYYAHESEVGPVYDVANFSRSKSLMLAFASLVFAGLVGFGAVYFWNPDWIASEPSVIWADAHQETKDLMRQHPLGVKIGVTVASLFSVLCLAMTASCVANAVSADYYIRVGEGGLSLRVPDGLWSTYQRDIPWPDVAQLKVVQEKRFGALSRNDGNIGGELQLRTHDGTTRIVRLDQFRQDAWLIHQRIEEAKDMHPSLPA